LSRMSPFRGPASAAKNSVPDSSFERLVSMTAWGASPNRRNRRRSETWRFCGDIRRSHSGLLVSVVSSARSRRFLASGLRMKNSVPGGRISSGKWRPGRAKAERTPGGRVIHLPVFPRRCD
jgi:hypothetical protein